MSRLMRELGERTNGRSKIEDSQREVPFAGE